MFTTTALDEAAGYTNIDGDTLQVHTRGPGEPVKFTIIRTKRVLWFKWHVRESVMLPWPYIGKVIRQLEPSLPAKTYFEAPQ